NLSDGTYTVDWRALSKIDGHIADGSYALGVGVPAPTSTSGAFKAATSPTPTTLAVAARAAFYLALVVLLGTAWTALLIAPGALAAMVGDVTSSHAAASSSKWVQGTVQWVHFASAAVWLGGLGALLLATTRLHGDDLARAARRYSTVAGVALALVVATGVTRAV